MNFGQTIMKYRRSLGLTQEGLAQKLGVTNQAVSKWESDQSCPDVALLPTIADLFGITIDQLFGREQKGLAVPSELPWPDDDTLRVVLYQGHQLRNCHPAAREIRFFYEGPAMNVHSELSVSCESVMGGLTAGGMVTCETVYGNVTAGGDVKCEAVVGSVDARGNVRCEDVSGSVNAGGIVTCEDVGGDVHAGGYVTCEDVGGSVTAGGRVHCDHWER